MSLLFAEVLLTWHVTNYLLSADPNRAERSSWTSRATAKRVSWFLIRAVGAGVLTLAIGGLWPGVLLAGVMFFGCLMLPLARLMWVPTRYLAELELVANLLIVAVAEWLIAHFNLQARWALFHIPVRENLISIYTIAAALLIFVVRGGTYIVRGVLDRAGTMPPPEAEHPFNLPSPTKIGVQAALPVDTIELNHGRLIGNVERLILVLFVANGQYTALAFFFAAKGIIRSKDVESRAWADYLILGSLTSFLVAVVVGLVIQATLHSAASQ
ncbi:MAG TPA: hypothetical protein VKB88_38070 [Bryobacteraceae bacterium]|nr:hypothetical protein [Bryobacteraceae bacterium]